MPIYEYLCDNCGHHCEFIQRFSDEPKTFCENCQSDNLKKLVSAPQFKLKGSGWYETDFKNKAKVSDNKPSDDSKKTAKAPSSPTKTAKKDKSAS